MFDLYISQPVGLNANRSSRADIKAIQSALAAIDDLSKNRELPYFTGSIDGQLGEDTIAAIEQFQEMEGAEGLVAYGKIDPNGPTIEKSGVCYPICMTCRMKQPYAIQIMCPMW